MTKHFKSVKIGIIMGILLFSVFAVFTPSTSAKALVATPIITVTPDKSGQIVVPNSAGMNVTLTTTLTLTGPLSSFIQSSTLLSGSSISVTLTAQENYDWIDASITGQPAVFKVSEVGKPYKSSLSLTITQKAQAFTQGKVTIIATSSQVQGGLFSIESVTQNFEVPFVIGYWPVINAQKSEGVFKQIGPLDTADFTIDLQNMGNGYTLVSIEVVESPGGDWSCAIDSSVHIQPDSSQTVHLRIKPPHGFGFQDTTRTFKVKITPSCVGQSGLVGTPEVITFTVQSVGFSPGSGFEIPLIVTILVVLFVVIYIFNKWRKK